MPHARLSAGFQLFLSLPKANWALLGLISACVGLCYFQDPVGLSNELSCEAGSFSCNHKPHKFLQPEVLRLSFPALEPWVARSVSNANEGPPGLPVTTSPAQSSQPQLPISAPPTSLNECFLFNSLVVRLHTVGFSGSSGYFLFLKLLLSLFWLHQEAKCIYLRLHLGQKSQV